MEHAPAVGRLRAENLVISQIVRAKRAYQEFVPALPGGTGTGGTVRRYPRANRFAHGGERACLEGDVMKRFPSILLIVVLALACGVVGRAQERARRFVPVTDAMLQKPDPGDWLMWRRTLDGWGYSPLNQINRNNVAQLRMVWTRGLGTGGNQEGTPLVHDGVMYVPNPGDHIQAIDAKTGDVLWEYKRKLPEGVRGEDQPHHRDVGQH